MDIDVCFEEGHAQIAFAADELCGALAQHGHVPRRRSLARGVVRGTAPAVVLGIGTDVGEAVPTAGAGSAAMLAPEGFCIRVGTGGARRMVWVLGADEAGAMYGGLEVAESVRIGGLEAIKAGDHAPYMPLRGIKFNIPLDVRTPSYSDACDAAQRNIATMWDFEFWREVLDRMAMYRYNLLSLWNLHPFPSLVRVPEFPDVALDDVRRSTVAWRDTYNLCGLDYDDPEIVGQTEVLLPLTMDEKIVFWRNVMRYARERHVAVVFMTWNIFVNGTAGAYGIDTDIRNETTAAYIRASVRELFRTYPDLAGIGLTTGENMPGASAEDKEAWAFATYGQGVLDAVRREPGRRVILVHRQHMTGAGTAVRHFRPVLDHPQVEFVFSFKYAKAHVFSSTTQAYHHGFVEELGDVKTLWTLRNDDAYHFRWGAPEFVRAFIRNIPHGVSRGFYYGSDQYIWGREFLSLEPAEPRELELAKHWYHWMLWGRLGYDPDLGHERLCGILQQHFPMVSAPVLYDAWQAASMIYPVTTGFHWGALDFQWYIEACKSQPGPAENQTGFHDVNRFITLPPHPGTDNVSIPDYVAAVTRGRHPAGTTPLQVAEQLHGCARRALDGLERIDAGTDRELRHTCVDIRAMACLGRYYAHKILGATHLALFRKTGDSRQRQGAVRELEQAEEAWNVYTATASSQYHNPLWTNRVGVCDWDTLTAWVHQDVEIARSATRNQECV